jgi:tripeptide aminopeptidase
MENTVNRIEDALITDLVVPRFLTYVRCWTTSDRHGEEIPSTPGQWDLARILAEELRRLGLTEVELTGHGYVLARIPASPGKEAAPATAFMAHLDTAGDVPGKDVQPRLVKNYDGRRIELSGGLALDPAEDPDLAAHRGRDLIHADGTTLLGADDKAGIAEIMGALEYILAHPEVKHGPVELIFSPDEETGRGMSVFPREWIKSAACYTLDGGRLGELEVECFNAYEAEIQCTGKAMHPGYARGIMANAALMAAAFATMLPRSESPEATDGYYGYYNPMEIRGDAETAVLTVYVRDFERSGAERRLAALECFARAVEAQFPGGKVRITVKPQYYNMKEKILTRPMVLETLKKAASNLGIDFYMKPIRGGTDGARLTELGIPTPNIFTGGRNWHSRMEWASVSEMTAACKLVIELVRLWGAEDKAPA